MDLFPGVSSTTRSSGRVWHTVSSRPDLLHSLTGLILWDIIALALATLIHCYQSAVFGGWLWYIVSADDGALAGESRVGYRSFCRDRSGCRSGFGPARYEGGRMRQKRGQNRGKRSCVIDFCRRYDEISGLDDGASLSAGAWTSIMVLSGSGWFTLTMKQWVFE